MHCFPNKSKFGFKSLKAVYLGLSSNPRCRLFMSQLNPNRIWHGFHSNSRGLPKFRTTGEILHCFKWKVLTKLYFAFRHFLLNKHFLDISNYCQQIFTSFYCWMKRSRRYVLRILEKRQKMDNFIFPLLLWHKYLANSRLPTSFISGARGESYWQYPTDRKTLKYSFLIFLV